MQKQLQNPYKIARDSKKLSREFTVEALHISVGSCIAYESDRTIPPDDVVLGMVELYDMPSLAHQHLIYSSAIARSCLPELTIKELPEAILSLLKEVKDLTDCRDDLIDIGSDAMITDDERPRWEKIVKELKDVIGAAQELIYASEKE